MAAFIPPLLLADIFEIIGALVGFGALVLWVIQKIVEANKEVNAPKQRQAAAPRQPQGAAGEPQMGGQPGVGQQADPLRNQVEEFLRRAGRGPEAGKGQQGRHVPPTQEIEVLLDENAMLDRPPARAPLRRESRTIAAQPVSMPSDQRPARRPVTPRKRKTLAERATERAAARADSLAKKVSHLGQRVIEDDQQFDVQLKAKFDHTVGTLAAGPVSQAELVPAAPSSPAGQIAAMLANPDGVRQAIILNEILRRPSDRW
jgi:hypothetical protein